MQIFEGVGIALGSLQANKVRASLTILGVAIGVAVVMIIASIITGVNRGVTDIVEQLGPRTFFVFRHFQGGVQINDGTNDPWRRKPPLSLEEGARIERLESIAFVVANEDTRASAEFEDVTLSSVRIQGRGSEWLEVSGGDVYPGRSFTALDQASSARVAVVNIYLAEQLFGPRDPMDRRIKIAGVPYTVIGVWTPPPDIFGEGKVPTAVVPHNTYTKHVPHYRGWMAFLVKPTDSVTVAQAIDDVTATLRSARGLRPGEENTFDVVTQDKLLAQWNQMTGIFFLVMVVLSSVGLMVGGVGVVAIMMISVTERTREIGVRKALGAKRREILWQFLVEGATLTLVGGTIGMLMGGGAALLVRAITPLPADVPLWSIVVALAASALTGILFGLYPAAKAARLDPVEALRYE
jgi:putative ABC transport system permease protein